MKKYVIEPLLDIISISKQIRVTEMDDEDMSDDGGLEVGLYSFDSIGRLWQLKGDVTELIALLDLKEPQRQKERIEARERYEKNKPKRKRKREDA